MKIKINGIISLSICRLIVYGATSNKISKKKKKKKKTKNIWTILSILRCDFESLN